MNSNSNQAQSMQAWKSSINNIVYDGGSIQHIDLRSCSVKKLMPDRVNLKMSATGELNFDDSIKSDLPEVDMRV